MPGLHKGPVKANPIEWNALLRRLCEEPWCLAVSCQAKKRAGPNVDVRVGGANDENQEASVDNVGEDGDVGKLYCNDKGTCRSTCALFRPADEELIGVRHRHTKDQRAQDIEEDDAPQGLADGLSYRLARVRRLAGRLAAHGDDEASRDEHDDDEEFDRGHPEFRFAEERYVKKLQLSQTGWTKGLPGYV